MFEPRCGARDLPNFGCGHARQNSRINFYECSLPVADHPADYHLDEHEGHRWQDYAMLHAETDRIRAEAGLPPWPRAERA